MRTRRRFILSILSIWALFLPSCMSSVRITESPVVSTGGMAVSVIADLTLEVFRQLAALQVQDPAVAPRLLETDPRDPAATFQSLGIDFESFRRQLESAAQVRPVLLFLDRGADPVEEARMRDLPIASWPDHAPPALLAGPQVDTLVLFQPLTGARAEPAARGVSVRAQLAALNDLRNFSLAAGPPKGPISRRFYRVRPDAWKPSAVFEHTRCDDQRSASSIVTKLAYQGGAPESLVTPLQKSNWRSPCELAPELGLHAVTVRQTSSRQKAGKPVIIAASYLEYPEPGPLLSSWIPVR